jgi:hypothetical protein
MVTFEETKLCGVLSVTREDSVGWLSQIMLQVCSQNEESVFIYGDLSSKTLYNVAYIIQYGT